jgi:hypothetical protein
MTPILLPEHIFLINAAIVSLLFLLILQGGRG